MGIELAPKKGAPTKEELRKFFNAEHGKKDLTPEQVKEILNCTPEQAVNNAILSYLDENGDELWNEFLANASYMFEQYNKEIKEAHKDCILVTNKLVVGAMKYFMRAVKKVGGDFEYSPHITMEYLHASVICTFSKAFSVKDMQYIADLVRDHCPEMWVNDTENFVRMTVDFLQIAKYVRSGGDKR